MKNPFRKKARALNDKPGHYNPCSHCWRFTCRRCLVFYLADFSLVLRSSPKLSADFEKLYNQVRGISPTTRQERREIDRGARKMEKQRAKVRRNRENLRVVDGKKEGVDVN